MEAEEYKQYTEEITDWDQEVYQRLTSIEMTGEQVRRIVEPPRVFERQTEVMAVHWHPEIVPLELVRKRIQNMYPNCRNQLIIPTQHNEILCYDGFCGVEVDTYSREFNRKVQLLFHFEESRIKDADILQAMLRHTWKYRSTQFFQFMETLINPALQSRLEEAVEQTGIDGEIIDFVRTYARKLKKMVDRNYTRTPAVSLKNKLLPNYFMELKAFYDSHFISKALVFLKNVKKIVKKHFVMNYFYETPEMIEEVRALGGGIVVPHPEQFWPILLADYDVDGYEVWNPQSRQFTEFLINVVIRKNRSQEYQSRPLLIFMGDDTHLGEKIKEPDHQNPEKAGREIGYQPAWDDPAIQKSLIFGNFTKTGIMQEYRDRLLG